MMDFPKFIAALIGLTPLPADQCNCPLCSKVLSARRRFEASMVLVNRSPAIVVPTTDEWIGLNLKEMDGEI